MPTSIPPLSGNLIQPTILSSPLHFLTWDILLSGRFFCLSFYLGLCSPFLSSSLSIAFLPSPPFSLVVIPSVVLISLTQKEHLYMPCISFPVFACCLVDCPFLSTPSSHPRPAPTLFFSTSTTVCRMR